jgi:tetratricopeptide (TPR) repeat protein
VESGATFRAAQSDKNVARERAFSLEEHPIMRSATIRWTLVMLTGLVLSGSAGCAGNNDDMGEPGVSKVSTEDAAVLNAQRSPFDNAKDPPLSADTRFAAGRLAETQGAPVLALEQYRQALLADPKHKASLYRTGVVQTQLKNYPQAVEAWKKYIEATGGSSAAWGNLGFCHELSGNAAEAEAAYRSGIARDPKSVPCRVNYGLMLARKDRKAEAVEQLSAVLSPAEVHYNLGSVYEQTGKSGEAKAEYTKALELDPAMKDARVRLAGMQ